MKTLLEREGPSVQREGTERSLLVSRRYRTALLVPQRAFERKPPARSALIVRIMHFARRYLI